MTLKDIIKYCLARIFFRKIVLFSFHEGRKWNIKKRIKGYIPFFYELDSINLNYFNVIVPLTLHAEKYINAYPELFSKKTYFCPSDDCIELCDDKELFHNYLETNGFKKYTPRINEKFNYPYIVKRKVGLSGKNIFIITDKKREIECISEIESGDYFSQEYIGGLDEYAAQIIYSGKKIVFFRALKYSYQEKYNIKGPDNLPASIEIVNHDNYKPIFGDILLNINYQGFCCFDYKISNNQLKILELNPRYGAWTDGFISEALAVYNLHGTPDLRNQKAV